MNSVQLDQVAEIFRGYGPAVCFLSVPKPEHFGQDQAGMVEQVTAGLAGPAVSDLAAKFFLSRHNGFIVSLAKT
jgi:hypothetical protein